MSEESPEKFTKNDGLAEELGTIVTKVSRDSPRGELSKNFIMGISDVGSCRERLRRFLKEEPPSDEQNNYMAAFVGTAVGDLVEKNADTWLTQDKVSTVLRIENWDVTLVGTMDMRRPGLLIDNKTKNGTEKLKGPQQEHIWQVSIYALGLIQAGLETKDVTVGICYWDRSGVTQTPVVFTWKFDPEDIKDVQRHLSDVVYALAYNEEAPKDKPRHFCQEWCEYYSACRVPDTDVTSMFTDEETVSSVTEYIEIRDEIKALEKRKSALQRSLSGANGNVRIGDQLYQIRTTQINPVYVSYERPGFTRLDIHKSRKATS